MFHIVAYNSCCFSWGLEVYLLSGTWKKEGSAALLCFPRVIKTSLLTSSSPPPLVPEHCSVLWSLAPDCASHVSPLHSSHITLHGFSLKINTGILKNTSSHFTTLSAVLKVFPESLASSDGWKIVPQIGIFHPGRWKWLVFVLVLYHKNLYKNIK